MEGGKLKRCIRESYKEEERLMRSGGDIDKEKREIVRVVIWIVRVSPTQTTG